MRRKSARRAERRYERKVLVWWAGIAERWWYVAHNGDAVGLNRLGYAKAIGALIPRSFRRHLRRGDDPVPWNIAPWNSPHRDATPEQGGGDDQGGQ